MFLPLRSKNPPEAFPWVTWTLIAINVLVFAIVNKGMTIEQEVANTYGLTLNNLSPMTVVTSTFLHGDFFHILFNLWFLIVVGLAVEGRMKWWKYLILYFLAALAGDALHLGLVGAAHPDRPGIGASGAIMGVMGASLYIFPHSKVQSLWGVRLQGGLIDVPMWAVGAYYVFWDLVGVALTGGSGGTGNFAHLGGVAAGFLIAFAFRISRDDSFVSEAKATMAEGGDYTMLNSTQLKEMGVHQPDNTEITLACLTRIIRDGYKLDPEVVARFKKQMPAILASPKQVQSAGWVVSQLREKSELPMTTVLRLALEVEKTDDFRLAKNLFDWIVRADGVTDEDRQMAAYRLAMIMEVKELSFIHAQAMYKWLAETYPMGSMSEMARTRMNALEPLAARQRGPAGI